jgi:nucleotide-binding universal stress UspA family protein
MSTLDHRTAKNDFKDARRRAAMERLQASIRGTPFELLPFEEVRQDLRGGDTSELGLHDIPLDAIVGSVGRYKDYTRGFFPKSDTDEERWSRVKAHTEYGGMEPITVYKIGNAYFVNDGNHRVSVARQQGFDSIQAYVTEVQTRVPLSPDDSPNQIICKARYAEFLEKTNLDKLRPKANLQMNVCGHYRTLVEQIEAVHYLNSLDPRRATTPFSKAVTQWYDTAYVPLTRLIRKQGLAFYFPELTETDLYVLVLRHRVQLNKDLDWHVDLVAVTGDLARRKSRRSEQRVERVGERVRDALTPDALEAGPSPGRWRKERLALRPSDNLISDMLIAGRGVEADANTIRHAAIIAQRERSRMLGLRVVANDGERKSESVLTVQAVFEQYLRDKGLQGEFAIAVGPVARTIVERSAWVDLLVLSLIRKKGQLTATGFGTDFNKILQRSPRPVLVVPEDARSDMDRALLAYDGSTKADEALYLATYAAKQWGATLTIVSAGKQRAKSALKRAEEYLVLRDVEAIFVQAKGPAGSAILEIAAANNCNLIIMGGFGFRPVMQLIVGSTVNRVLRATELPVFVCR